MLTDQCGRTIPDRPYTRQEILDLTYETFITNKAPRCATRPDLDAPCRYAAIQSPQVGCAVGSLIPVDIARRWDDNTGSISVIRDEQRESYRRFFDLGDSYFLLELQRLHDRKNLTRDTLQVFAARYDLTLPE